MRNLFSLFFTIACVLFGRAQNPHIRVELKDNFRQPITGAYITIDDEVDLADEIAEGQYLFQSLSPGEHWLKIRYQGYKTVEQNLILKDRDLQIEVRLQMDTQELEEVLIDHDATRERRSKSALDIEIVQREFIRRNMGGSLMQSLKRLPGIERIDIGSGQSKPLIRGMGFNRLAVIDKGIKHEAQQWGADHGLEIDQFGIDEVEVIKGAASYAYGSDAIGGVINIPPPALPAKSSFGGDLNLVGKTNNDLYGTSLHLYKRTENWFAEARMTYQDYADYRIPEAQIYVYSYPVALHHHRVRNTAGRELDFSFSSGYVGTDFRSIFYIDNTHSKSGFFANAHGLEPRGVDTEQHDRSSRDILKPSQNVNHFKIINRTRWNLKKHTAHLELGYQNNDRDEYSNFVSHGHMPATYPTDMTIPSDLERHFKKEVYALNLKDRIRFSRHDLQLGVSGEFQNNTIGGWSFLTPAFHQGTWGGFAHDRFHLNEKTILHASIRYDYSRIHIYPYEDWFSSPEMIDGEEISTTIQRAGNTVRHFNSITGGIGINYNSDPFELKAHIGKSYRVPIAKELGANGVNYHYFSYEKGDPDLDPEESYQIDLGARFEDGDWTVEASPFYNYFPNYIYLNPTPEHDYLYGAGNQVYEYQQSRINRFGGELRINYQITAAWSAAVAGEYLYAKQLSGEKKGYTLPFSPPPTALFTIHYEPTRTGRLKDPYLSVDFRLSAPQNRIVPPERKTAGYGVFDLQAGGDITIGKQEFQLSLQMQNVFNTAYMLHTSFYRLIGMPEPGRNFVLSLKVPFEF